ncbi:MAG: hypothetical protein LW805_02145 [Oxalobacteraceae bacterium]|jgi:hypothetical protein|nr:hypothetical protein [Oxalobacteraceae bacterium]
MLDSFVGERIILHEWGGVVVARYYDCVLTMEWVAAAHRNPTIGSSLNLRHMF